MKTKAFFFLAALGLLVSTRSIAAQPRVESEVIVLPTYIVSVPRHLPFENQMQKNLSEVRQEAHVPITATFDLPFSSARIHAQKVALNVPTLNVRPGTKS